MTLAAHTPLKAWTQLQARPCACRAAPRISIWLQGVLITDNWQAYHETGDKGSYDKLIMPKDEALKEFSALEGSEFYKGLQGMSDGQAANVNVARDSATGQIATITADQGGKSAALDYHSSLTGSRDTHEALRVVDTGLRKHTGTIDISHDEKHKIYDHRDVHKTGEEIVQGTGVSGEPEIFVLDPKKFTALSMIETGNSRYAQMLSEGNKVTKSANATVFAAGWSHEVSAFISRKGTKFDFAEADASVKAGFEALGMGATMQGTLRTGSEDKTSSHRAALSRAFWLFYRKNQFPSTSLWVPTAVITIPFSVSR